ncbi:peptidylprolyl isomerase PrsA [Liquorilactobacillus sicerae]|uniref:peptidylprolyl isomerase PrsA n=1 Tax=Liquorilactobacillus sicerae TaxID=1416943 RepID=UPI002480F5FA|nr:peptidylprolyl isomerase PrsA [Liquorilactobacillus sicerae]
MKKWLLAAAGVILTLSLGACSKTVATTSGGKITESAYYDSMKKTSSGKQILEQMILDKVLEKDYGDKVSQKKVNNTYNTYKKEYGSSFSSLLSQNSMTKSSFKKSIRSSLLLKEAVKDHVKITNKKLKKQWKEYQPKTTVAHILVSKKATAEKIITQLNNGASFSKLAKKYSTDSSTKNKGGKLSAFDNTNTSLASSFKKAAFNLKQGEYTKTPVKTSYGYHVIKSIKRPAKGKMSDHIAELKKQIISDDMNDSTVLQSVISKVLKGGNVSIKDDDLKNILSSYLSSSSSSSSN